MDEMDVVPSKLLWNVVQLMIELRDKVHGEKQRRLIEEAQEDFSKESYTHKIEGVGLSGMQPAMGLRHTLIFLTKIAASDAFTPEQCKLAAGLKARLLKIVNGE